MAAPIQYYVNFVVYFADESEYNFAVATLGGVNAAITPAEAAAFFALTEGVNYNTGGPLNPIRGMYGFAPYGIGLPTGNAILFPGNTGKVMDGNVLSVQVASTVTPPLGPGPDGIFTWSCILQRVGGATVSEDDNAPMPPRRWISGFEAQAQAEGGASGGANNRSRDSSRTLDGVGWSLSVPTNVTFQRSLDEYGAAASNNESWERFYFRLRRLGTANNLNFWWSIGSPSPAAGAVFRITTSGDVNVINRTAFSVETTVGTITDPFGDFEWHRVDIIVKYNAASVGGNGRIRVYIDSTLQVDQTISNAQGGLGTINQRHTGSVLGTDGTATGWEWDFDDWHNAEVPNILGVETLNSLDWLCGTHIELVRATTGTQTGWTGPFQTVNQIPTTPGFTGTPQSLQSSTGSAQIVALTEANEIFDNRPSGVYLGAVCALFSSWSVVASGTTGGTLAYSIGGGLVTGSTTTLETTFGRYNSLLYPGGGEVLPMAFSPMVISYTKAANGVQTNVHALESEIQYVGVWGVEDNPEFNPSLPRTAIYHNAFWPLIAQAFLGPNPGGPVCVKSGTYTGNGTEQTITAPLPFHFLWIRNVTNPASGGIQWYATTLGGHINFAGKAASQAIVRVDFDPDSGVTSFTLAGSNANYNAAGNTYQYVMFCDPGMVYLLAGSFKHSATLATADNPLLVPTWQANCGFFIFDRLDNDSVQRLIYKGPGDSANGAHVIDGTAIASAATFNVGSLTSLSGVHNSNDNQTAYVLFRTGSQCELVMVQAYSYTGDGTGARTITSTPTTGRFPCFVMVSPANAVAWFKDPSDVGTSSRDISGGTSSSAITGVNVDQITVGSTLNANGIVYNVFIIPGSSTSFANGTFQPGDCSGWIDYPPPEEPPPGVAILGNGGLTLNGSVPKTLLMDVSGIYTIISGKRNDTLYDRLSGQPNVDVAIPNPNFKTGYIGG